MADQRRLPNRRPKSSTVRETGTRREEPPPTAPRQPSTSNDTAKEKRKPAENLQNEGKLPSFSLHYHDLF